MNLKGTNNPHSIFKHSSFKQSLKRMGYDKTIEGFNNSWKLRLLQDIYAYLPGRLDYL